MKETLMGHILRLKLRRFFFYEIHEVYLRVNNSMNDFETFLAAQGCDTQIAFLDTGEYSQCESLRKLFGV